MSVKIPNFATNMPREEERVQRMINWRLSRVVFIECEWWAICFLALVCAKGAMRMAEQKNRRRYGQDQDRHCRTLDECSV